MKTILTLLASIAIVALSIGAAGAEDNGTLQPSGYQHTVCAAIFESCQAACSLESDEGLIISPQDVCEMQCSNAYKQCMKGISRTSVGLGQSQRNPLLVFAGDGTPNTTPPPPSGGTDQPVGPTGGSGGGFNPGDVFGGPATTVGPTAPVIL